MGRTHALSGAAAALGAVALYNASIIPLHLHPTIAIMGTVVVAGAALAPDIDSWGSTVVRSFGIFGRLAHWLANALSLGVYNATKTRYDADINNGHRTFFHTTFMAIIMGGLVALITLPGNHITVLGKEFTLGQFNAIILLGIFLNLALAGLFEKQIKKARRSFGPYLLMLFSIFMAGLIAAFIPGVESTEIGWGGYSWLGLAVGFGWFMHLIGDFITKMGVPLAWPIKVRRKRWYSVAPPVFLRISAGGAFEVKVLFPVLAVLTIGLLAWNIFMYFQG